MEYLDAVTIPYQVVLRDENSVYINQYPQSFYVCKGSACFIVAGTGGSSHFLKKDFSEIDWDLCQPSTSAYDMTTNEGRMAYLSSIFTGQMGTLVASIKNNMIIVSQASTLLLSSGGEYVGSPAGAAVLGVTVKQAAVSLGARILKELIVSIGANDTNLDTEIELIKIDEFDKETILHRIIILPTFEGIIANTLADIEIAETDKVAMKYNVRNGSGTLLVAGTTLISE